MLLSTAIRIGSMTTKQIRFQGTDGGTGRCALGAAIDATGHNVTDGFVCDQVIDLFPVADLFVKHPVTLELQPAYEIIIDLNDHLGWTRESIAKWVERIELEHKEKQELLDEVTPIKETV